MFIHQIISDQAISDSFPRRDPITLVAQSLEKNQDYGSSLIFSTDFRNHAIKVVIFEQQVERIIYCTSVQELEKS